MRLATGIADALWSRIMLLALIPALLSIALFVATLRLKPGNARATILPTQPLTR
jgi:hypothetical protein